MLFGCVFFFFMQKTAYEMRISDWSSDVCSSDLAEFVDQAHIILCDGIALMGRRLEPFARRGIIHRHAIALQVDGGEIGLGAGKAGIGGTLIPCDRLVAVDWKRVG